MFTYLKKMHVQRWNMSENVNINRFTDSNFNNLLKLTINLICQKYWNKYLNIKNNTNLNLIVNYCKVNINLIILYIQQCIFNFFPFLNSPFKKQSKDDVSVSSPRKISKIFWDPNKKKVTNCNSWNADILWRTHVISVI